MNILLHEFVSFINEHENYAAEKFNEKARLIKFPLSQRSINRLVNHIDDSLACNDADIHMYDCMSQEWSDCYYLSVSNWRKNVKILMELDCYCKQKSLKRKKLVSNPFTEEYLEKKFEEGLAQGMTDEEAEAYAWNKLTDLHGGSDDE